MKKDFFALLPRIFAVLVSISVWPPMTSQAQEVESFLLSNYLDRKIRLASWRASDALLNNIRHADTLAAIDFDYDSESPLDYDVILAFVPSWEVGLEFPYAELLGFNTDALEQLGSGTRQFESETQKVTLVSVVQETGHKIQFIVFNVSNLRDVPMSCFVQLLVEEIYTRNPYSEIDVIDKGVGCVSTS